MKPIKRYQLFDSLELIALILCFICALTVIIDSLGGEKQLGIYFTYCLLFAVIAISLIKILKLSVVSQARLFEFSKYSHLLSHHIRNKFYYIKKNYDLDMLTQKKLDECVKETCQKTVDAFASFMSASTGNEAYVAIRMFFGENVTVNEENAKELQVKVLCKSSNTKYPRETGIQKVSNYTDLYEILIGNVNGMAISDLVEFDKQYQNIRKKKWAHPISNWKKVFKSIITVPIRIQNDLSLKQAENHGFDLLGFLCVDFPIKNGFKEQDADAYIDLCKQFADQLYCLFDRFLYYREKVLKKESGIVEN